MAPPNDRDPANVETSPGRKARRAETGTQCWICGSKNCDPYKASTIRRRVDAAALRITDKAYGETCSLSRCRGCGFVFADPLPHPELTKLYAEMDDPVYLETSGARRGQMRDLLKAILRHARTARTLLDIGAASGLLVAESASLGIPATGIEPSRWLVEAGRKCGVDLLMGTLSDHASRLGLFDVITLIDVLEHSSDPVGLLREAVEKMGSGGRVAIVTPDIGSLAARLAGRNWWHFRIAHVCFFTRPSMRRLLDSMGLRVVADEPCGWTFPLSYLFERLPIYLGWGPARSLLDAANRWRWLSEREVRIRLGDSRLYIARRQEE